MSVEIVDREVNDISIDEMNDGEIGVITKWGDYPKYIGSVIQRYNDILIVIGEHSDKSFSTCYDDGDNTNYRVRILPTGTLLKIVKDKKS